MTIDRNVFSKTHCALIITYVFYRYWDVFTRRFQIYIDLTSMKQAEFYNYLAKNSIKHVEICLFLLYN